jgi:uncharacterized membrane protein
MASTASAPVTRSSFRAKHALFAVLGLMTLFVLYHNERFIIDHRLDDWKYYFPVRWWLLPHGLAGALALFIGPVQFSTRFRQRHVRVHRLMGKFYLAGVAIAGPMAVYLSMIHNPPQLRILSVVQASSWWLTTGLAFYCIRHGNVQQHRQWMTRSYSVTMIFVMARVLYAIPPLEHRGLDALVPIIWLCNLLAWIVPDLILQWNAVFGQKAALQRNAG